MYWIDNRTYWDRQTISDDSMKRGNWIPLSTDTVK